jgi:hypothetical protein
VVSAHNFESLDELLAALRAPRAHRPSFVPTLTGDADAFDVGAAVGALDAPAGQPPPLSLPITRHFGRR